VTCNDRVMHPSVAGSCLGRRTHAYHSQEGSIPSRPAAERPPEPQQQQNGMFGPNVQFQAGFGFFPSLFGLQFVRTPLRFLVLLY
jgi:hypothetical protein